MKICGKDCNITVGGAVIDSSQWTLVLNAPEIETPTFADGDYKSFTTCSKDATLNVQCYDFIANVTAGSEADIILTVATDPATTITLNNCKCTSVNEDAPAGDLFKITYDFRITEDPA